MTNEEFYSICKQPEPTCPTINKVIDYAEEILKVIYRYHKTEDVRELHRMLDTVETLANKIDHPMELIRDNCSAIRQWGEEWKELALKELELIDPTY